MGAGRFSNAEDITPLFGQRYDTDKVPSESVRKRLLTLSLNLIVSPHPYSSRASCSRSVGAEMPRISISSILAVVIFAATMTSAEARRGFRIPIVVPGFSGSETIQKVLDLPDIPALKRSDGKYIDLGYLHKRGGKGEWIGFIGSSKTYIPLTEAKLKMLLMVAGVPKLPPVPKRSGGGGFSFWWIIAAAVLFGGGWKLLRSLSLGTAQASQKLTRGMIRKDEKPADWSKAHEEIARAAEQRAEGRRAAVQPARVLPGRGRAPAFGQAAPSGAGFGRRGR
jgi:hypothetical protein